MRKIFLKSFLFIFAIGNVISCADNEFLQQQNPNIIGTDRYWQDLGETETGLNAVYRTLYNPGVLIIIEENQRTDMAYVGAGGRSPEDNSNPFYLQTFNGSTNAITDKWRTNYQGVLRANLVIEALENLQGTVDDVEWTSQMAQARFFRGLFHYYLYTTFNNGSIIIRDMVPITEADFAKSLSEPQDVIDFIREDLKYAYANLYKKGEYPNGDITKVTSGAAGTVLGHSYLQDLMYEKAMPIFDDVIKNHGYVLETDMSKMFTTAGEFNSESILEINFTADNIRIDLSPWDGSSGTNWLNARTFNVQSANAPAWIAYEYKAEPTDPNDARNYYDHPLNGTTGRNVSLRASAMMALVDDNVTPYYIGNYAPDDGRFLWSYWGYGWWKKYQNHDIVTAENQLPEGANRSSKNVTINRLSEVYLMQAECKIKTGDITGSEGGLYYINEIRKRWGLQLLGPSNGDIAHTYIELNEDDIAYSNQNALMQHLMRIEKPLELGMEGHATRYIDFKRWEKSENYSFKDRLEELSNETYYGVNFTYWSFKEDKVKTKTGYASLVGTEAPSVDSRASDWWYKTSVLNYTEAQNGTFPIPFSEDENNSGI